MKLGQSIEYFMNGNYTKGEVMYINERSITINTWLGEMTIPKNDFSLIRKCY